MKTFIRNLFSALLISGSLFSCQSVDQPIEPVSSSIVSKLAQAGFSSQKLFEGKDPSGKDGYYIEGDIFLAKDRIDSLANMSSAARTSQYRTFYLVTGLPRLITIKLATTLPRVYIDATDEMVRRYNALGLKITFKRITSGTPTINIVKDESLPVGTYATSGFPYSYGSPYGYIKLKTATFNGSTDVNAVASLIAHEMGHCIGLRHTDWNMRCGQTSPSANEGTGTAGAIKIPYTPDSDYTSYMLSCGSLYDIPFSENDRIALNVLYGYTVTRY